MKDDQRAFYIQHSDNTTRVLFMIGVLTVCLMRRVLCPFGLRTCDQVTDPDVARLQGGDKACCPRRLPYRHIKRCVIQTCTYLPSHTSCSTQ